MKSKLIFFTKTLKVILLVIFALNPVIGFNQTNKIDYASGFTYKNGELDFFPFEEGRVTANGNGGHQLEYIFTDHLGNTRTSFTSNGSTGIETLQESHYYPFGMSLGGTKKISDLSSENKFTYNGKEFEDENSLNWYHYGVRYYDPQIAKWTTQDAADEFYSSYTYVHNDPVNFVDPDGNNEELAGRTIQRIDNIARELEESRILSREMLDPDFEIPDDFKHQTHQVFVENHIGKLERKVNGLKGGIRKLNKILYDHGSKMTDGQKAVIHESIAKAKLYLSHSKETMSAARAFLRSGLTKKFARVAIVRATSLASDFWKVTKVAGAAIGKAAKVATPGIVVAILSSNASAAAKAKAVAETVDPTMGPLSENIIQAQKNRVRVLKQLNANPAGVKTKIETDRIDPIGVIMRLFFR